MILSPSVRRFLATAGAVIALDQATKAVIVAELDLHSSISIIDGFLKIVHVRNPGAAFSMFAGAPEWFRGPFFIGVTVVAIVVLGGIALRLEARERWLAISLGGVLGGAIGNLIDRLVYGEVIDFVYVYWGDWVWPAFNVADSSISIAVASILLHSFRSEDSPASSRSSDGAAA